MTTGQLVYTTGTKTMLTKQGVQDLNKGKQANGRAEPSKCVGGDAHDLQHDPDCVGCWADKFYLGDEPIRHYQICRKCGQTFEDR